MDGANFKLAVWNALIVEMGPHLGPGAPKTAKACKSKYGQVCRTSESSVFQLILASSSLHILLSQL